MVAGLYTQSKFYFRITMLAVNKCGRKMNLSRFSRSWSSSVNEDNIRDDEWDPEWVEQDKMLAESIQKPWENLLRRPAQVLWRASRPPPDNLLAAQKYVLERGGRTNRQLWRTFDHIVKSHSALADQREVERRKVANGLNGKEAKATSGSATKEAQPVFYGPEQTLAGVKNRLLPNYAVTRSILAEAKSLLGPTFEPRRIIDAGIGCGAASAAVLDVFGSSQIDWIHGIDPSKSQREAAEAILKRIILEDTESTKSKTRITVSETVSNGGSKTGEGTFDLALCCYTLNELPHTASALALAAILWEKLANGGILVLVEPGTPDGFNAVRSVREMLTECCPVAADESADGYDQCHIIAPCTHNGRCPMERHKDYSSQVARENEPLTHSSLGESKDSQLDDDEPSVYESNWTSVEDDDDEWLDPDTFDPEGHPDWTEDSWDASNTRKAHAETEKPIYMPKYMSKLKAFDLAFCSFNQAMHGGERRSEKFSYLVAQKIIGGSGVKEMADKLNPFGDFNLADLIASAIKTSTNSESILEQAMNIEDRYLESDADELGLELVQGKNLGSWGRLIRPPLKRKGHIVIDFCSGEKVGRGDGKIIRHLVPRNMISKVAPGAYSAARKARWGGFWPDISSRLDDLAETDLDETIDSTNNLSITDGSADKE